MLIGILADSHDHLENIRRAVELFNEAGCAQVIHAGDIVSPIALPPFRKLRCPLLAVLGDNDGNVGGLRAGFGVLGVLGRPPLCWRSGDGRHIVVAHRREELRGIRSEDELDLVVLAHTHRPRVERRGQALWLNPGEACGWVFGKPTVAIYDTQTGEAKVLSLPPA